MSSETFEPRMTDQPAMKENLAPVIPRDNTSPDHRLLLGVVKANRDSFEHARSLYRAQLAPDFNPFQFIEPDEVKLSRIIGWLLDPKASHGQGERFLKDFTEALGLAWTQEMCALATVKLESSTLRLARHNRRIDILIVSGTEALAIENKPWAGDQAEQVSDYLNHLSSEYQKSTLLYLCGYAQEVGGHSISPEDRELAVGDRRLVEWNFSTFADWLDVAQTHCRADRVRTFIQAFTAYLRAEFEGATDVSEHSHMVGQITEDTNLLSSALDLLHAGDAIYDALCSQFHNQIEAEAKARGWTAISNLNRSPYAGIKLIFPEAPAYAFSVEFQSSPFNKMIFGVQGRANEVYDRVLMQKTLIDAHGAGRSSSHWVWYRPAREDEQQLPLPANWTMSKSPWLGIQTGETAALIIKCAKEFHHTLIKA